MKLKNFIPLGIVILVLLFLIYLQSCDIKNPAENVNVIFNTDGPQTSISVSIYDGNTGLSIDGEGTVTIIIEGSDKDKITDMGKEPTKLFKSGDGLVSFGVADGTNFPINITIIAKAENYLTTGIPLTIYAEGGAYEINMVNLNSPPDGVSVKTAVKGEAINGIINSEIIISTDLVNNSGGVSKLRIPQGTLITDNSGVALNGQLNLEMVYFNPNFESSLKCFPGGFTYGEGASGGSMVSAGFTSIVIKDQANLIAKNFSSGTPEITIEIPASTNNFDKGRSIQLGDAIPILSYDPGNGTWNDESIGNVIAGSNNNFAMKFSINHLSYYNFDFKGPNCSGKKIKFINGCNELCLSGKFYRISPNGIETYAGRFLVSSNDPEITVSRIPQGNLRMIITDISGRVVYNNVVNICANETTVIQLSGNIQNYYQIQGTLTAICPRNVHVLPTIPIYFRPAGTGNYIFYGYMVNGIINKTCVPFGYYDFKSYYRGYALYNYNVPINSLYISVFYYIRSCVSNH
ncbi:MAG: hypothetical protein K1X86_14005 [Ignavibacteria bacterium]|nr:hypothetical protein [Ignavibacteria bacterium]